MTAKPLAAPLLALALALAWPAPLLAQVSAEGSAESAAGSHLDRGDARTRGLLLGLAAAGAVAFAVRAAERNDEDDEEDAHRLPAECLRPFAGEVLAEAHGDFAEAEGIVLHDPGCLDARVGAVADLPLACAVTLRTPLGFETGFHPTCLAREGWPTE